MRRFSDITLSETAKLLVESGDERIALDPVRGVNRYGCKPTPDPDLLDFASATASVISDQAFQAADRLRTRLEIDLRHFDPDTVYALELTHLRKELLSLCALEDLPEPDVIFAASGTDLHRIAAQLSQAASALPILAIMVNDAETGSGVNAAIVGNHPGIEVATVALRLRDGTPRPVVEVDAEFSALAQQAYATGRHVLLIHTDISKTGMIAPSYACTAALRQMLGMRLDVLVDACQFRISPATLRACLACGYSVALTGSKFVGGPSFCGALLIPEQTAARLRAHPFPRKLSGHCSVAEWPDNWPVRGVLNDSSKFGLLLRWKAALYELRAFRALPEQKVARFLKTFAQAIQEKLASDRAFSPVSVLPLERGALLSRAGWDDIQTIFPFQLYRLGASGRQALDTEGMRSVYRRLPTAAIRCQLGQPVDFAEEKNALRLCLSARLIVRAITCDEADIIIAQARSALDQAACLAQYGSPRLTRPDPTSTLMPGVTTPVADSNSIRHKHFVHA